MNLFECNFCGTKFIDTGKFDRHSCKQKKRFEILKLPLGKSAFYYYKFWKTLQKYSEPTADTFVASKYFMPLIKFVDFCKRANIANKKEYIELMVKLSALPTIWTKTEMYMKYMASLDKKPPLEKIKASVELILKYSDSLGCKPSEIFTYLKPYEVITLLKSKKLTPWMLVYSKQFQSFLRFNVSEEQKTIINTLISSNVWKSEINDNPDIAKKAKMYVSALGL